MSSKKARYCLCIIALSFLLSACQEKKQPPPPPNVTTTLIKQQDVPIYIDAIGQAISPSTVYIRPQVAGKLINAFIDQGSFVKEGDIIYEIDPRPYQAILDEAIAQLKHDEALLKYAEDVVKRYKGVVEEDFISIINYEQYMSNADAARAQVDLDKAAITAAQINVDFCKIVAPVSGKISYFNVYVGNILAVDDPTQITTILPLSPIDIIFSLPQQQFELIRHVQGDAGRWPFIAILPESPSIQHSGTTFFIDNQLNQDTGTILLKGRLPNDDLALWPGAFIRVKVLYRIAKDALIVPPSSVLIGKDGPYVYIVDKDGKAETANVEVLTKTEAYTAIQSAQLLAGETIITDGQINIAPGLPVNVVNTNSK